MTDTDPSFVTVTVLVVAPIIIVTAVLVTLVIRAYRREMRPLVKSSAQIRPRTRAEIESELEAQLGVLHLCTRCGCRHRAENMTWDINGIYHCTVCCNDRFRKELHR